MVSGDPHPITGLGVTLGSPLETTVGGDVGLSHGVCGAPKGRRRQEPRMGKVSLGKPSDLALKVNLGRLQEKHPAGGKHPSCHHESPLPWFYLRTLG